MPDYDINDLNAIPGGHQVHGLPRGPRADVAAPSSSSDTLSTARRFDPAPSFTPPPAGPSAGYIVPNHGDPAARLPVAACEKLRRLKAQVADLNAVVHAASDRLNDSQGDLQRAEQRLSVLRANNVGGRNDLAIKEASERADAARAARDHAQAEVDARVERAGPVRNVLLACERYIEREIVNYEAVGAAPDVAVPELRKSQSWADAVAEVRTRIEKAGTDKQAALDAPWPSDHAKARARVEIEALAEKGRPGVMALLESERGGVEWPSIYQQAGIAMDGYKAVGRVGRDGYVHDPMALLIWANRDAILQAIEREIDAKADDRSALTAEQRAKKVAQAEAARYEAELIEEAIVVAAEQAGVVVQRRENADVRAVLGLSFDLPAPRGL